MNNRAVDTTAGAGTIARSPADTLRLLVALATLVAVLVVEWVFGEAVVAFFAELLRGLDALSTWFVDAVIIGTRALAIVLLGGGFVAILLRGRWRMLGTVALAAALAALTHVVLHALIASPTHAPVVNVTVTAPGVDQGGFPSPVGLAEITAIVTAAAPWTTRRWRRAGWVLVFGLVVTYLLAAPAALIAVRSVVIGWFAGAAALVALGAPSRRPTADAIVDGLARAGHPVAEIEPASVDARGSTPYFARTTDGARLFVKALGDDERSADLLFRAYRRVNPHDLGDEKAFSSLRRAVEHEALVALAARDLGVRTPRLVTYTTAEPNGFALAYEAIPGRSLDAVDPDAVTDAVLVAIWEQVALLRAARVAHRDLRLANIFLDPDGTPWIIDFGFSEMAAPELLLRTDLAELLTSSSLTAGAARAVASARQVLDAPTLAGALDRLHPWALSGATRHAVKRRPELLEGLRTEVGRVALPQ